VQSYGKAAAIGEDGELEHAAALLHPTMGAPIRAVLGGGAALIPSAKKRGGPGLTLDIPLGHKDAAYVRSHFDAIEIRVPDAPAPQRSSSPSPSPMAAAHSPASAVLRSTPSRVKTVSAKK
jgi:hypothetical protein